MLMSEETLSTFCQSWEQKVLGCHKGRVYAGIFTRDEYENTLRAHQQRHDEMKSDDTGIKLEKRINYIQFQR